nr:hypothetical protein [uncultured Methanobacterium sp.]
MNKKEIFNHIFGDSNNTQNYDLLKNIETKLLEKDFIKQIIIFNPNLGLKIFTDKRLDSNFRIRFSDMFFSILLLERNSILYREISSVKKDRFDEKYVIPKNSQILHTILSPTKYNNKKTLIADKYAIYVSIGKTVVKILQKQNRKDIDVYNKYNERYFSMGRFYTEPFDDPVFIGIKFFDILITTALFQKIKWHMGIENYYHFVQEICRNYSDKYFDPTPSPYLNIYSYFLHEIIDNLKRWVEFIIDFTDEVKQPLINENCEQETHNIIKMSVIYLVFCNAEINDKKNMVPEKDKKTLTTKVLDLYFKLILSDKKEPEKYGNVLKDCFVNGPTSTSYKQSLIRFLQRYHDQCKLYDDAEINALKILMFELNRSIENNNEKYY